jgi:hypothetical protein
VFIIELSITIKATISLIPFETGTDTDSASFEAIGAALVLEESDLAKEMSCCMI